jgi:hypothetical protein
MCNWKAGPTKTVPFPLDLFFAKNWINKQNQAVFIETAVTLCAKRCIADEHPPEKRTNLSILVDSSKSNDTNVKHLIKFWQCPAFVECLISLYDATPTSEHDLSQTFQSFHTTNLNPKPLPESIRKRVRTIFTESTNGHKWFDRQVHRWEINKLQREPCLENLTIEFFSFFQRHVPFFLLTSRTRKPNFLNNASSRR